LDIKRGYEVAKLSIFGNSNIGVYIYVNDFYAFVPPGLTKSEKETIEEVLDVEIVETTIAQTRLLGVLMNGNNHGLIIARNILPEELNIIKRSTKDLNITILESRNNAIGNLFIANSRQALAYPYLSNEEIKQISEVLDVEVEKGNIAGIPTVGSVLVVTDRGGLVHPEASDEEIKRISELFGIPILPGTVNFGVAFLRTGLIANNKGAIAGEETTGPELARIQMALRGE